MMDLYISCFLYDKVNDLWSNLYLLSIYFIQLKHFFLPRKTNVLCFILMTCFSYRAAATFLILLFVNTFVLFLFLETQLTTFLTST